MSWKKNDRAKIDIVLLRLHKNGIIDRFESSKLRELIALSVDSVDFISKVKSSEDIFNDPEGFENFVSEFEALGGDLGQGMPEPFRPSDALFVLEFSLKNYLDDLLKRMTIEEKQVFSNEIAQLDKSIGDYEPKQKSFAAGEAAFVPAEAISKLVFRAKIDKLGERVVEFQKTPAAKPKTVEVIKGDSDEKFLLKITMQDGRTSTIFAPEPNLQNKETIKQAHWVMNKGRMTQVPEETVITEPSKKEREDAAREKAEEFSRKLFDSELKLHGNIILFTDEKDNFHFQQYNVADGVHEKLEEMINQDREKAFKVDLVQENNENGDVEFFVKMTYRNGKFYTFPVALEEKDPEINPKAYETEEEYNAVLEHRKSDEYKREKLEKRRDIAYEALDYYRGRYGGDKDPKKVYEYGGEGIELVDVVESEKIQEYIDRTEEQINPVKESEKEMTFPVGEKAENITKAQNIEILETEQPHKGRKGLIIRTTLESGQVADIFFTELNNLAKDSSLFGTLKKKISSAIESVFHEPTAPYLGDNAEYTMQEAEMLKARLLDSQLELAEGRLHFVGNDGNRRSSFEVMSEMQIHTDIQADDEIEM